MSGVNLRNLVARLVDAATTVLLSMWASLTVVLWIELAPSILDIDRGQFLLALASVMIRMLTTIAGVCFGAVLVLVCMRWAREPKEDV